jgi:hypothetical protein
MPTRQGLDYHRVRPDFFICAYCYQAYRITPISKFGGMIKKQYTCRDDFTDEWLSLHGEYVDVWTQPHCFGCHRKIRGWQNRVPRLAARPKYKYADWEQP